MPILKLKTIIMYTFGRVKKNVISFDVKNFKSFFY